jgi:hypothetical protein
MPTISFPHGVQPTLVQLFKVLFPKLFVQSIILPQINKEIQFGVTVEYWEFFQFIGLWFLIATIEGPERRDFWAVELPGPHDIMGPHFEFLRYHATVSMRFFAVYITQMARHLLTLIDSLRFASCWTHRMRIWRKTSF